MAVGFGFGFGFSVTPLFFFVRYKDREGKAIVAWTGTLVALKRGEVRDPKKDIPR